ncbi:hypothetical protein F4778DRAFT_791921 [Xylariomycetidae sp. FL2044]|nr:hypothetical protein F4778DRAFT_791921 [Xylariomycetidae sp. FL2044]
MATTTTKKSNPLNGLHTAGIFSDMSIDGPEIGTLVLIVDRAKNLPNRKTIGKQDPYCAARLGKEAKKTTTDIRGGQTPKWDQELRFTVHDSPDYYQLKLSVFNDDKKTDLIGETWIDLRDIVVPGGGQSDQWHSLHCKGKYAGETRIEITYYDSRPKPEKPVAKPKPVPGPNSEVDGSVPSQRSPVKRRPLPSDPVTGQAPSPVGHDQVHTPPRAQPNPPNSFIPNQSPLQAVEYNTPPSNRQSSHADSYVTPPHRIDLQHHHHRSVDRNERFPAYDHEHMQFADSPHSRSYEPDPRASHSRLQGAYDPQPQPTHQYRHSGEHDERPPPPPAHRARNSTGNPHDMVGRGSFDGLQHKATPPMRHDVLRSAAHRVSVSSSAYPGRPTYRPYDSAPDMAQQVHNHDSDPHHTSPPRHHSYDSTAYDSHYRSMQPTVEDVPESWTPPTLRSRGSASQYDQRDYSVVPSPAPLNLSGRGSAASGNHSPAQHRQNDASMLTSSPSPISSEEYSQALTRVSRPRASHSMELEGSQSYNPEDYDLPPVPPTLVPGVDPALAREISDRLHHERSNNHRYTLPASLDTPLRGRQHSEPPASYDAYHASQGHHPSHSRSYDRSLVTYSGHRGPPPKPEPASRPRGVSPSPGASHTIKRKSVSPAPPAPESRRLSSVPFGPDDYDALNPSVVSSKDTATNEYTNAEGKIVTSDGREVDPSDHLPMDTWAPEPEPKKQQQTPTETRSRPSPSGAQPMPPSGRRQLRIALRPQSMSAAPVSYTSTPEGTPSPASTGRNRLQKKTHRQSTLPAPISSGSSPLGPSTPHQRNSTPPRALVRAGTFDYENYGHSYSGSPGAPRHGYGNGPPIPPKVPMMSGGLSASSGSDDWALMEEMSRIDIGTGRARRHGGY